MKHYITKLPNGITLIEVPTTDTESVMVNFMVDIGSRNEKKNEHGISHFLEHFLFKGTEKFPNSRAISELIEGIGGETNASTGKEFTQYYIKAHRDHGKLLFEILTDMLQKPLFDPAELEKEKGVIVEEINMYKDIPKAEVGYMLEELLWPGVGLGRTITGTPESVTEFNAKDFRKYIDRCYTPQNLYIGISGSYDRAMFKKAVKSLWSGLKKTKQQKPIKAKFNRSGEFLTLRFKTTEQAHFVLGFPGLAVEDKQTTASKVLSAVLGAGMSSRLFYEIREQRGLAYYIGAGSTNYKDTGVFHIDAGVQVNKIEEALKVTLAELKKIREELVLEAELNRVKAYLRGRISLSLEDHSSKLDWFMDQSASSKKIKTASQFLDEIDKVSSVQIRNLANKLLDPKNVRLALIGPYKSDKQFKKILKQYE